VRGRAGVIQDRGRRALLARAWPCSAEPFIPRRRSAADTDVHSRR
jgi:hypothetical protein